MHVVVVVSDIVKRRAVMITLTRFNSFHIFGCYNFSVFYTPAKLYTRLPDVKML